ncbi:MAG: Nucleoside triphosphate pyrophosphohydrolase [Gammaproteobacteria bacterium]|nr:Nucleoside triphosphate pyrophosphohydrolase [Gammaproteobacteria bacterium]
MSGTIDELIEIMAALRDPETGCPWDVKQDFSTIAPYTIEEAYEVSDAIERGNMDHLREELGDLLLQVVFHAQMAREANAFGFDEVVASIRDKMVERHPHVFERPRGVDEVELREAWEARKESERQRKGGHESALDGVARALPALLRAQKLIKRAARKGFSWSSPNDAFTKCREELEELQDAGRSGEYEHREEELGDLLLACVAIAGQFGVDAEKGLRGANDKFERRFRRLESKLRERHWDMADVTIEDLSRLWEQSKVEGR